MHASSRTAFVFAYSMLTVAGVLAWRRVEAAPQGDLVMLTLAGLAGFTGLTLLAWWLRDAEKHQPSRGPRE